MPMEHEERAVLCGARRNFAVGDALVYRRAGWRYSRLGARSGLRANGETQRHVCWAVIASPTPRFIWWEFRGFVA